MSKLFVGIIAISLPAIVFAAQDSPPTPGGNSSSSSLQVQNQNQVQTREQQQSTTSAVQSPARVQSQQRIRTSSPTSTNDTLNYGQTVSQSRRSEVANAVQALIQSSYQIQNQGLGDQVRLIASAHSNADESADSSVEKAQKRSAFAKFFVGANYKELKNAKAQLEQNRLRIVELQSIMASIENESEYTNLLSQIEMLNQANVQLENELMNQEKGFSLFGWLNKLINRY